MKLDLDTTNLNWNNATVKDYRYIHHLMMMIHERWTKLGIPSTGFSPSFYPYRPSGSSPNNNGLAIMYQRYSPGGLLTWDQLSSIYYAMIYLGIHCYFNPDNFSTSNWERGDNRKLFNFNLNDMCKIADFDFFAHPFLPGQPLEYYSQFLYPIKKVLAAYKQIATDYFFAKGPSKAVIAARYTDSENDFSGPPSKTIDGVKRNRAGRDLLDFWKDKSRIISNIKKYYNYLNDDNATWDETYHPSYGSQDPTLLGYEYTVSTVYEYWNGSSYKGELDVVKDLVYTSICFNPGQWIKCQQAWPAGITYKKYLCHTTYVHGGNWGGDTKCGYDNNPKYFDSPWPMIIDLGSGTVPSNNIVVEFIEIPGWSNAPLSHGKSTEGKRYPYKLEKENDSIKYVYPDWKGITNLYGDRYAAYYYPLFVFDVSSLFKYD